LAVTATVSPDVNRQMSSWGNGDRCACCQDNTLLQKWQLSIMTLMALDEWRKSKAGLSDVRICHLSPGRE